MMTQKTPLSRDEQIDAAWRQRRLELLEQDPTFCQIVDGQVPPELFHWTKGATRGFPRHGMMP